MSYHTEAVFVVCGTTKIWIFAGLRVVCHTHIYRKSTIPAPEIARMCRGTGREKRRAFPLSGDPSGLPFMADLESSGRGFLDGIAPAQSGVNGSGKMKVSLRFC